ncbi:YraN family protein [Marinimicrobium sp. ABcell2]|uniref:YraN family protein n=1 Tax=Marinimicrobium sp. ABcell2 TaxID=3069751 RepID=UPI0027B0D89D|nr:YraN family protein [Marinimicrobium sp. ABcell2]MDQ2075074.1 YraN family protein [Marinimicrobium sp. ABcell2]
MSLWPSSNNQGQQAEALAETFLQRQGLQPRERNYRCKAGEIDLIMSQGETLIFVEVRLRSNARFASAAESVDARKQHKLLRAAQHYLLQRRLTDKVQCRFDVVAFDRGLKPDGITWLPNAFGA